MRELAVCVGYLVPEVFLRAGYVLVFVSAMPLVIIRINVVFLSMILHSPFIALLAPFAF